MKRILCLIFALGLFLTACAAEAAPENGSSQQNPTGAQAAETEPPAKPLTDEELSLVQDMLRSYIQQDPGAANFTVCTDYGVDYKFESYPLLNNVMFLKNEQNIFCEQYGSTAHTADWWGSAGEEERMYVIPGTRDLTLNPYNEIACAYWAAKENGAFGSYQCVAPRPDAAYNWTFFDFYKPGFGGGVEQWRHSFASMPKHHFRDFLNGLLEDEALCRDTVRFSKETFLSRSRYCLTFPVHSDYLRILVPNAWTPLAMDFAYSELKPVHLYNAPLTPGEVQISLYFQESNLRCVGEVIDATACAENIRETLLKSSDVLPGSGKYIVEKRFFPGMFTRTPSDFPKASGMDPNKLILKKFQSGGGSDHRTIHSEQPIFYDGFTGDLAIMDGSFPAATIFPYAKSMEDTSRRMFWLNLDVVSYMVEKETLPYADGRFEATLYTLSMKELFNDEHRDDMGYLVKLENKQDHEGLLVMCWDRDRLIEIVNGIRFDQ